MLAGAKNLDGARALIDFMLSEEFQASPARQHVRAAGTRRDAAAREPSVATPPSPSEPFDLPAAEIGANRDRWIDEWTQAVLR